MKDIKPLCNYLIEVSYEIVAKLGGINTVIKTKAPFMKKFYGDSYVVVGLYDKKQAKNRFRAQKPQKGLQVILDSLKKEGIICHYGKWLIPSSPKTILIDITKLKNNKKLKDKISRDYWVHFLKNKSMYNNSMLFSYAAGNLINKLLKLLKRKKKVPVVNIHEYMTALTLFYLRKHKSNVPIVFTTHATILGRSLAFQGRDIYKEVISSKKNRQVYNKKMKHYLGLFGEEIYNKQQQEKACARNADAFTAVSSVTSKEAGYLLDKNADVITPNGLEVIKHPNIEEQLAINYHSKEKIYRFLEAYFKPYYPIKEKKDCLFFYTAGRNEIYTKGYDIFFDALEKLNKRLKDEKSEKNIFVLLLIMVEGKQKRDIVIKALRNGKKAEKRKNPPTFAFNVKKDKVLSLYRKKNNLQNKKEDKVKVIFYPAPTNENDGLLSMPYKKIISGMSLGIFPSLYEPWGYTPLVKIQ